jgi:hypothetical protein
MLFYFACGQHRLIGSLHVLSVFVVVNGFSFAKGYSGKVWGVGGAAGSIANPRVLGNKKNIVNKQAATKVGSMENT